MDLLSTGVAALDDLLDGGLESDAITLVFGEGGSGKTNLALQCARQVVASGGNVAYIDTEGVSSRRLEQVFDQLAGGRAADATDLLLDDSEEPIELTPEAHAEVQSSKTEAMQPLDRLFFFTPFDIKQQEAMVSRTALLKDVKLIVVDSINMHYRLHIDADEKEASRSLLKQLHHLTMYARKHDVPVLITGQVYGGEDQTQPFARRVMEHMVKALIRFEKREGGRRATILKHRSIEEGRQAEFKIGAHGLEDLGE